MMNFTLSNQVQIPAVGIGTFMMTPDQAEQAVETVRQIMEEDRSVFRFRKGAEADEVVVEWRIKIPKFNWREG